MVMMSKAGFGFMRMGCLVLLAFVGLIRPALAVDTNAAPAGAALGAQDFLRSYLQIQEQLRDTQLAIEKNRQEAAALAASNSLALDERLRLMEKSLANARLDQLTAIEHSDRMILLAAGVFVAVGCLVLVLVALLQWTAVNRLTAAAAGPSAARPPQLLSMGEVQLPPTHALEQSNTRFLNLIERLEQRIRELEASLKPSSSLPESSFANGSPHGPATEALTGEISPPAAPDKASTINLLLNKSQTLMKLDKPEAALDCFDEILALDPNNADALVKKGAALERLQRFDEAVLCYDLAVARDNSMSMAYLYKGGLCHRLGKYSEALACYEQALKPAKTPLPQTSSTDNPPGAVSAEHLRS